MSLVGFISCERKLGSFSDEIQIDKNELESKIINNKLKYIDIISLWKEGYKNQMSLSKKIDEFNFTATYKPYSILTMDENDTVKAEEIVSSQFKNKLSDYSSMHFVIFNIENKTFKQELLKYGVENNQGYYDRISYYSFASKKDAYVIEGNDTLPCTFVNFERTYEANPSITLNFAFDRKSNHSSYQKFKFVFEDSLFNKGKLMFDFNTEPILLLNYLKPIS